MTLSDRRARERAGRERLIVEQADVLLGERGYLGLNLDEIGTVSKFSQFSIKKKIIKFIEQAALSLARASSTTRKNQQILRVISRSSQRL